MSSAYQSVFIETALRAQALKFGEFTLKSGRKSPYFFNLGLFCTGEDLAGLAQAYAELILASKIEFDVVFGPAYKGIPIGALAVAKLAEIGGKSDSKWNKIGFTYNRKEKKDHGEGGMTVGSDMKGKRVLILDDVITAGTAINEAYDIIKQAGGTVAGIALALDRQETTVTDSERSAVQAVSERFGVPIVSVINLNVIIDHLSKTGLVSLEQLEQIKQYKSQYAPKDLQ